MIQTELHRHLDCSIRAETLLRLAQERGLEGQSTSLESFKNKFFLRQPFTNLSSVLGQFTLFQKVLNRPEVLERVGYEAVEDCWKEGTRRVEFRFSPGFVSEKSGLSWDDILLSFLSGIEKGIYRYPDMRVGLICIATREHEIDSAHKTVEFFLKNKSRMIGLDLAGDEAKYPCRLFESAFKKAIHQNSKITIHAGEASGPESIWEAIEFLGARRIGHGVSCWKDAQLLNYLSKEKICLEICPTSNWITQAVPSLAKHPLPEILRSGVPISINTDDPGIFGVSLHHETQICREQMGLTLAEIEKCQLSATEASFL
jgi:adenosine deaminase